MNKDTFAFDKEAWIVFFVRLVDGFTGNLDFNLIEVETAFRAVNCPLALGFMNMNVMNDFSHTLIP
jgi:hypothetical protein